MSFWVIIPARFASTRLPGKVLLDLAGKPMLQRTYEKACASGAARVLIATDEERVARAAAAFGAPVCLTRADHRSGTERIAEVLEREPIDPQQVVVNLQADEPFMPPALIAQVAADLTARPDCEVSTLCEPIRSVEALLDPNAVKVARAASGLALYFSRAPIPCYRDDLGRALPRALHLRHIGIYAYRAAYLARYPRLAASALEAAESLEQLKVLEAGDRVHVAVADTSPGPGVDTPAALEAARARLASGRS